MCHIAEDDEMPRDKYGNIADIAFNGVSSIGRMNMGRPHEQSSNAAARDLGQRLRRELGLAQDHPSHSSVALALQDVTKVDYVFEELMGFYEILSPLQAEGLRNANRYQHVAHVLEEDVFVWSPPNNPINHLEAVIKIWSSKYRPTYAPVTYKDVFGHQVTTVSPVLIGEFYMILLEKTTDEWSAAASVRQQHLGLPAKLNNSDKYSTYGRAQAGRGGSGEAEIRNQNANVGADVVAELMELSNNPLAHREHLTSIFNARYPSNIDRVVDPYKVSRGHSRPNMLLRNLFACYGLEFTKVSSGE